MNTDNSTPETITIQLTKGQQTVISAIDADLFIGKKWQAHHDKTYGRNNAYQVHGKIKVGVGVQKNVSLHRIIMERIMNRQLSSQEQVDHINGNPLDNRRENLRLATHTQNQHNQGRSKNNKSGYKGVYYVSSHKAPWRAALSVNKKRYHLGYFPTPEEAYAAYCEAAKKYHGEFANFG